MSFDMALPLFALLIIAFGLCKKADIYSAFISGAKEAVNTAFSVLPYISAMIFAVGLMDASGIIEELSALLSPALSLFGIPVEMLPLVLMRPFSGGGSTGLLAGILNSCGADSLAGRLSSVYMASSETLFYSVSVYLGSLEKPKGVIVRGLLSDLFSLFLLCLLARFI